MGMILIGALAANTASFPSMQDYAAEPAAPLDLDAEALAANFSRGLTYATVSYQLEEDRDTATFLAFHDFLTETYPATHAALTREVVATPKGLIPLVETEIVRQDVLYNVGRGDHHRVEEVRREIHYVWSEAATARH